MITGPVLLIGGARSGKSALAVEAAMARSAHVTFIATAEARDAEMAERIERHRGARPAAWTTVEEPIRLLAAIQRASERDLVVLDCLTLWVSNLIERGCDPGAIAARARDVAGALCARSVAPIVVTNEVGSGIVPDNELARKYRDALGTVNTIVAASCSSVFFVAAGRILPMRRPEEVFGDDGDR